MARAKLLLLDTLGCGFATRDDDTARAVLATLDALGDAAAMHGARSSAAA